MMEWDDWYQMQKEKNKNVNIKESLSSYKREQKAFNEEWRGAEGNPYKRGWLSNPASWESGQ
jgi:hypothetical protein